MLMHIVRGIMMVKIMRVRMNDDERSSVEQFFDVRHSNFNYKF